MFRRKDPTRDAVSRAVLGAASGLIASWLMENAQARIMAWGTVVWLLNDELLVPALGFSRRPAHYPPSTHAKAFASHLVCGAATDAGYRALRSVIH